MSRQPLFSIRANDCDWSYTRGTGNGGQKKNKTSSAVHCRHRASTAYGYSEASRSQLDNRRDAFRKMSETDQFQQWVKLEFMRRSGQLDEIERSVERELQNVKLEIKIDGRWTEVKPHQLVDNPEDFVLEIGIKS
ncbi:MAG: peptide chain release factor-like protein [Thaumarchaeota archaeon]|nr:peptide chain release factor-like protein [Nitrososphaerota archaeon]